MSLIISGGFCLVSVATLVLVILIYAKVNKLPSAGQSAQYPPAGPQQPVGPPMPQAPPQNQQPPPV